MTVTLYKSLGTTLRGLRAYESTAGTSEAGVVEAGSLFRFPRVVLLPVIEGGSTDFTPAGNTVGIEANYLDETGAGFNPLNSLSQVQITDPNGTIQVAYASGTMTVKGVGIYLYPYQFPATTGTWLIQVRGQLADGSGNYLSTTMRVYIGTVG